MSTDKDFNDKFISVVYLQNYIELLIYINELQSTSLTSHFLLFLSNIVSENDYIQEVFYSYKIFDLIYEKLSDESNDNDIKASILFFSCFSSLKKFPDLNCVLKLQNIFVYFHHKAYSGILNGVNIRYNEEVIDMCLWGLFFVYFHQDNELISEDNFDLTIIEELINSCESINKCYQHLVLGIIGNITSKNDDTICDRVYNEKIALFIMKCLKDSHDKHNKIKAMWVISNLAIGTKLRCLFQYEFYNTIIDLMKEESDQKVQYEFIELLVNCFSNCNGDSWDQYEKLFNDNLFSVIYTIMTKEQEQCNQILIILIDTLCSFNIDSIIIRLKNIGVKEFLEKCDHLMTNKDNDIQMQKNRLLEEYFKEIP